MEKEEKMMSHHERVLANSEAARSALAIELDMVKQASEASRLRLSTIESDLSKAQRAEVASGVALARTKKSHEHLEVELRMERIALEDERKRSLQLQAQVEEAMVKAARCSEAEEAAREVLGLAQREASMAKQRADQLSSSFNTGRDPEKRLQVLLAEQREVLEEAARIAREENAARVEGLKEDKRRLEERIQELEAAIYELKRAISAARTPEEAKLLNLNLPMDAGRVKSNAPVTKTKAFKFASDRRAEKKAAEQDKEAKLMREVTRRLTLTKKGQLGGVGFLSRDNSKSPEPRGGDHDEQLEHFVRTQAAKKLQRLLRSRRKKEGEEG